MDVTMVRQRLVEICDELDRSITVLNGGAGQHQSAGDYPQDPADAGANLSENERSEAVLAVARRQRSIMYRRTSLSVASSLQSTVSPPKRVVF